MENNEEPGGSEKNQDPHAKEDAALRARLSRLQQALDAKSEETRSAPDDRSTGNAMSLGLRVLSEFVAAVLVGTFFGWQIDQWSGTSPLFLLIFICLGTVTGFWNVYRIAAKPER